MKLIAAFFFTCLFFFSSCGGVSVIRGQGQERQSLTAPNPDFYSPVFLQKITIIKEKYKIGKSEEALNDLKNIEDTKITALEQAFKRNLMGVINFSKKRFEQAIYNFELATTPSKDDPGLYSQVQLNLSSALFRLGKNEKAYEVVKTCDIQSLNDEEKRKYSQLLSRLAKDLNLPLVEIEATTIFLADKPTLLMLRADSHFPNFLSAFQKISSREKMQLLEKLQVSHPLLSGYVGYLEVEKFYYDPGHPEAKDILNWLESKFTSFSEIQELVKSFKERSSNFEKIEPQNVGIVLPLSGKKKQFGERSLLGIDVSKKELIKKNPALNTLSLFVKDSEGSGAIGSNSVKELIEHHNVTLIIGGLFPDEAVKEYLEAKKHGVLFISLSQIYLPKEQKDYLLLEIPGSVESQINKLFSKEMINKFGKRAAILYSEDQMGNSYLDEFWRKAEISSVKVTGIVPFEKNLTDFREPVKQVLGLKYRRDRQEEFQIVNDLQNLDKNSQIRRVSVLKPQIDFDWIFIPSLPRETLQIIPIFSYFDANNLNFIGGPTWRAQSIGKESDKWGDLFFVGDDVDFENLPDSGQINYLTQSFGQKPRIVEMSAYDAFEIASKLLVSEVFSSRKDFNNILKNKGQLSGVTGHWFQSEGIWMKTLASLKMRRGKVEKLF